MVMPWLPWLLAGAALLVIILELALGSRTRSRPEGRRRGRPAPVRLANSSSLLSSAPVRSRIRRRRLLLGAVALLGVGVLTCSALIAARPVRVAERNDALANRDIILCLDVSTSMVTTDSRILDTFSELLDTFDGERVGLVAWNATAQTMVPLTDDYDLLRGQFEEIADVLDFTPTRGNPALNDYYETFAGTFGDVHGSSLVGDGLASCALAFDAQGQDRSRSIILATDNQVYDDYGEQIYSLQEAADLAQQEGIRLFSLYGADPRMLDPNTSKADMARARNELKQVTLDHGGLFYEVDDAEAASGIVTELEADDGASSEPATDPERGAAPARKRETTAGGTRKAASAAQKAVQEAVPATPPQGWHPVHVPAPTYTLAARAPRRALEELEETPYPSAPVPARPNSVRTLPTEGVEKEEIEFHPIDLDAVLEKRRAAGA